MPIELQEFENQTSRRRAIGVPGQIVNFLLQNKKAYTMQEIIETLKIDRPFKSNVQLFFRMKKNGHIVKRGEYYAHPSHVAKDRVEE